MTRYLAMGAKALLDAALAAVLLTIQPIKYRAFSFWAVISAGAAISAVPLAWPEVHAALRHVREKQTE